MVSYEHRDITQVTSGIIVQQCNCISTRPRGLAATLELAFPGSCPYSERIPVEIPSACRSTVPLLATRSTWSIPGTVAFRQFGNVWIVNVFGQVSIGPPQKYFTRQIQGFDDTAKDRLEYFRQGLEAIYNQLRKCLCPTLVVYFPYKIGCGLAGGSWPDYLSLIEAFATDVASMHIRVVICQHEH